MEKQDMGWLFEDFSEVELESENLIIKASMAIVHERINRDMSQVEFADLLGVSQAMVSKIESGECNFSIKKLSEITYKLGLKLDLDITEREPTKNTMLEGVFESHSSIFNFSSGERLKEDEIKELLVSA